MQKKEVGENSIEDIRNNINSNYKDKWWRDIE